MHKLSATAHEDVVVRVGLKLLCSCFVFVVLVLLDEWVANGVHVDWVFSGLVLVILLVWIILGLFVAIWVLFIDFVALFFQLLLELLADWFIFGLGFLDVRGAISFLKLLDYLLFFTLYFCFYLFPSLLFFFEIFRWNIIIRFIRLLFISLFPFLLLFFVFYYFIICFCFFWWLYSCIFYYLFTPLLFIVSFPWNVTALYIHIRMNGRVITNQILL